MGQKWMKMAKNGPKNGREWPKIGENGRNWAKNGRKRQKMAENGPKTAENGQKWPKMAKNGQNGQKWQIYGQKWPKMAMFWLFWAIVDHFWSFLPIFEGAPLGAVGSTAPEPPAEFGARPTKQAAGRNTRAISTLTGISMYRPTPLPYA